MTIAQWRAAQRRARCAAMIAPMLTLLGGGWWLFRTDELARWPWYQLRQWFAREYPKVDAEAIIRYSAPLIWVALSLLVVGIAARLMRKAGWRRRARFMRVVGALFVVLAGMCWLGYSWFAVSMGNLGGKM